MSWIKEANKIGKYERSYKGFRFYCTKEPEIISRIEERDGEQWRITDFMKGDFVAIDKTGLRFEAHHFDELAGKIDMEIMRRVYSKREGVELVWK